MNTDILPAAPVWQKSQALFFTAVFLIFVISVGVRWYYISNKTLVHLDESLSITLSTYNDYGWNTPFEDGIVLKGDAMRQRAYAVSPGLGSLGRDLFSLRMDSRDPAHSNLYYTFYRVALTGLDTYDMHSLLWRGGMLNLAFFALSFGLLLWLARLVFDEDRSAILLALLVATLNPATLSNSLFVRPYQMQETLFIGMALLTVWYVMRLRANQPCPGYGLFFAHALTVGLCLLSGYFSFFYIPLLGLILLWQCLTQKQHAYIPYFIALTALGALLAWALYASFMVSLFIDRGIEASEKFSPQYLTSNAAYIFDKFTYKVAHFGMGTVGAALLLCAAVLSYGRLWAAHPKARMALGLLLVCLVWSLTVFTLAPYKKMRYFMPAMPLILFFACILIQYARYRRFLMPLLATCVLFQSFGAGNIEFYKGDTPIPPQEAPYVASFTETWRPSSFIPYIEDSQTIIFYNNCAKLREALPQYHGTFLLIDKAKFQNCHLEEMSELKELRKESHFFVYQVGDSTPQPERSKP